MLKTFRFKEARPLLDFIDSYSKEIVGHTIRTLYINFWPDLDHPIMSDEPVILEMDNRYILLEYLIYSDLTITIGNRDELRQNDRVDAVMSIRDNIINYFEFCDSVKKEDVEGQTVIKVTVDRFSHAFEYNIQGDERPEGGDYFSTIKLYLDNGMILCFCGADAEADGYICSWCEKSTARRVASSFPGAD